MRSISITDAASYLYKVEIINVTRSCHSTKPRIYLPGMPCHIIQRGNNRDATFILNRITGST